MKLKAVVITKYFYPVAAGIEVNIRETYKKLLKMNYDISIHTSTDTLTQKNVLSTKKEIIEGLHVQRYPFGLFGFSPKIDWDNTDLICIHNFNVVPHLFILLRILALKSVGRKQFKVLLTPHGGFTPEWSIFSPTVKFLKKLYHNTIGVLLINSTVDIFRAVSEWEKAEVIKLGIRPNLVKVISNGIEDSAFGNVKKLATPSIKKTVADLGTYIIQVGRIYPIKNYETTIRAMVNIPKEIKFVIVGPAQDNDDYQESLKSLAKQLGLEKRVIFLGVIQGYDKYYLIKHAQMMVHMAIWESFCNVVHEGMSQGLVCIVANNSALPFLIKNGVNGYLVDTHDSDTLAKRITYIFNNKQSPEINYIRTFNKTQALQHSWTKTAKKLADELESLFNTKYRAKKSI